MHAQSLPLCLTLCDPMDCSLPGSSVHGILQARILEWVATPSSRESPWPRDETHVSYVSCIAGRLFTTEPPGKPNKEYSYMLSQDRWISWKPCWIKEVIPTRDIPHESMYIKFKIMGTIARRTKLRVPWERWTLIEKGIEGVWSVVGNTVFLDQDGGYLIVQVKIHSNLDT